MSRPEQIGKVLEGMGLYELMGMEDSPNVREAARQILVRNLGLRDELGPLKEGENTDPEGPTDNDLDEIERGNDG